jgi:hypothetical protein
MQINATNQLRPLPEPGRRANAPSIDAQDTAVFSSVAALKDKLSFTPGVRPEAVALARELISQPSYPPDVTIQGIANLLASNLRSEGK